MNHPDLIVPAPLSGFRPHSLILVALLVLAPPVALSAGDDYVDFELRTEVDALQLAVDALPTHAGNYRPRLRTIWRWANAYALHGWPIDPELPWTVGQLNSPDASPTRLQLADIDSWVREFSYREMGPSRIGKLETPMLGPFPVDDYSTLIIDYTVGSRALLPGDGLLIAARTYAGGTELQTSAPDDANFLAAETDVPGVRFAYDTLPVSGWFSGRMGKAVTNTGRAPKPFVRIAAGELPPGSRLRLVLGETAYGSPGLHMPAVSIDGLRFHVWLRLESDGVLINLPELPFRSVGGPVANVRATAPSVVDADEPVDLHVWSGDQFRNRATGPLPRYRVELNGQKIAQTAATDEPAQVRLPALGREGVFRLHIESQDGRLATASNPVLVERDRVERIFWGETHGHSGFSEGVGTIDGFFRFARDDGRLDFVSLSEHDLWMDDSEWLALRDAAIRYNDPGRFVTFLGYEWTVHFEHGGHHNVLFRSPGGRSRIGLQDAATLTQLYDALGKSNQRSDLLLIPHAHNPGNWWHSDSAIEHFVEIVSNHGTFEWFGQAYLAEGHRIGFLGGSDDHYGHPGLRPLRRIASSDNFGGLVAVFAAQKTADSIFDALRARRGYATNGRRMLVDVTLNGHLPGSQVPACGPLRFRGQLAGTTGLESLQIFRNERLLHDEQFVQSTPEARYIEIRFASDSRPGEPGEFPRQWQNWIGTASINDGDLVTVFSPRHENIFSEAINLDENSRRHARFFVRTRGSEKNVLLEPAKLSQDATLTLALEEPSIEPQTIALQGFQDSGWMELDDQPGRRTALRVRRIALPDTLDRVLDHHVSAASVPGDRYYVRVTQTDGGIAWTSPWFLTACRTDKTAWKISAP